MWQLFIGRIPGLIDRQNKHLDHHGLEVGA